MEYRILFVVISFLCYQYVFPLQITDCGSYLTVTDVQLEGCDQTADSCVLYIGTSMHISFTLNNEAFDIDGSLANSVSFYVGGIHRFNLTVDPLDPCDVLACPLNINYTTKYEALINVDKKYQPLGNAYLEWALFTGDWRDQLMCFQFPISLQN